MRRTTLSLLGKYTGDSFAADKLLIKCPSKYEAEKGKVHV